MARGDILRSFHRSQGDSTGTKAKSSRLMRFVLERAVMNGPETVLDKLDDLLARVEDEVHEIDIIDADLLEESAWFTSSRQTRREILQRIAQTSVHRSARTSGPHLRCVNVSDEATVKIARHLAYTPLHVIVENFSSDGALVKFAIAKSGTPEIKKLCLDSGASATPPAFQLESPGGHGEILKLLDKRLDEAAARGIPPRVLVVTDSDSEWPGDIKSHAQNIQNKCVSAGAPCVILTKRTAENYVPDVIWKAWAADHPRSSAAVDALIRLSHEQRDHVNIDKGNSPPWNTSSPGAQSLFSNVSAEDEGHLRKASLKGRGETAISFILDKYASLCTTVALSARDQKADLKAVLQMITDEL